MRAFYLATFVIVIFFFIGGGFSPESYRLTRIESDKLITRQEYYGEDLGKIYKNRFGVIYFNKVYPSLTKFESVFFSSLDKPFVFLTLYGLLAFPGYKRFL